MACDISIKSFSIYNSSGAVVFDLNATTEEYTFYNKTLELEIQAGIPILRIARSKFEDKSLVKTPDIDQIGRAHV